MKAWMNRQKIPILLSAILALCTSFYLARAQHVEALAQRVIVLEKEIAQLPEPEQASPIKLDARFAWIDSVSDFLRDLAQWARERDIVIVSIEPKEIRSMDGYNAYPVRLELQGGFRAVGNYLTLLEGLPRPIQVTGIRLDRHPTNPRNLVARFDLVLYIRGAV